MLQIVPGTSVDGPGLRTSVYLAGCSHGCPGCHNPASWDFNGGEAMTPEQVANIVISHRFNVTLTGGDPLMHSSIEAVTELVRLLTAAGLKVWCYTGFRYEQLQQMPSVQELLKMLDAIVDGPFVEELISPELPFRGSSNQRILRPDGTVITEHDNPLTL